MTNNVGTVDTFVDIFEVGSGVKTNLRNTFVNRFAYFTQYLTWPILAPLFRIFFKVKIEGAKVFDNISGPFMIVSNHISFYDSFLFRLVLGLKTPHLPLRFMAVRKFESKALNILADLGIIDLIYSLFGVFTVTPGLGVDKNLAKAQEILRNGGNVVIYPEGRINNGEQLCSFKKGAAILYKRTDIKVIPVAFSKDNKSRFRKGIIIRIGDVINVSKTQSPDKITARFFEAVSRLR